MAAGPAARVAAPPPYCGCPLHVACLLDSRAPAPPSAWPHTWSTRPWAAGLARRAWPGWPTLAPALQAAAGAVPWRAARSQHASRSPSAPPPAAACGILMRAPGGCMGSRRCRGAAGRAGSDLRASNTAHAAANAAGRRGRSSRGRSGNLRRKARGGGRPHARGRRVARPVFSAVADKREMHSAVSSRRARACAPPRGLGRLTPRPTRLRPQGGMPWSRDVRRRLFLRPAAAEPARSRVVLAPRRRTGLRWRPCPAAAWNTRDCRPTPPAIALAFPAKLAPLCPHAFRGPASCGAPLAPLAQCLGGPLHAAGRVPCAAPPGMRARPAARAAPAALPPPPCARPPAQRRARGSGPRPYRPAPPSCLRHAPPRPRAAAPPACMLPPARARRPRAKRGRRFAAKEAIAWRAAAGGVSP